MNLFEYEGIAPTIADDAWIAPTATVIGDVTIESGASIWYGATIRGDDGPVVIRANANVQDNAVIHTTPDTLTEIGPGATVAHLCLVHGAVIEAEALIGNGSIVLDGARVGARSMIAAASLVPPGRQIPPGVLAMGSPVVVKGDIAGTAAEFWVQMNPDLVPGAGATPRGRHPSDFLTRVLALGCIA